MRCSLWLPAVVVLASPLLAAVDFATEIHPILSAKCVPCHSGATPQAQLLLNSRTAVLKGGRSGPAIVPGKPNDSLLLARVEGREGSVMPPTGAPLKESDVEKLRQWIAEGAVWPDLSASSAAPKWETPLAPRKPTLPSGTVSDHPIDRILAAYWKLNKVTAPQSVSDASFARRAYFDTWGIPPPPAELDAFLGDKSPDKRAKLIATLLGNNERYTDHWISFWNDLLRNDIGVVYHGERKAITGWLEKALRDNVPYRQMVRELLNPEPKTGPEGFLVGVNWRGDINASQTPFMQASQNTAQIFLGINLKCASCHDSFINKYRLSQAYGLAAFFTDAPELELVRCDMKTGRMQKPEFLYPELAKGITIGSSPAERRKAAADLFTHESNGRVSRTIVNRYWQRLIGRGIVEPVDEMDNEPWSADLLDWLASDFDEHKQDIKHLIARIMTSAAYQIPTVAAGSPVFKGPTPRRVSAEEFVDTASAVTGEWRTAVTGDQAAYVRDWKLKSSPLTRSMGRPIRDQVYTTRDESPTTFQALELANGATLAKLLRRGARRLIGELQAVPVNAFDSRNLRKGLVKFDVDIGGASKLWLLAEDAGSYDTGRSVAGWSQVEFVGADGVATPLARVLPDAKEETFNVDKIPMAQSVRVPLGSTLVIDLKGRGFGKIRGAFAVDDSSLQSDIGTLARFFLFTADPDRDQLVRVAGEPPIPAPASLRDQNAASITTQLFRAVLGRTPTAAELDIALGGKSNLDANGVEDLLWTLFLHPEFQYLP